MLSLSRGQVANTPVTVFVQQTCSDPVRYVRQTPPRAGRTLGRGSLTPFSRHRHLVPAATLLYPSRPPLSMISVLVSATRTQPAEIRGGICGRQDLDSFLGSVGCATTSRSVLLRVLLESVDDWPMAKFIPRPPGVSLSRYPSSDVTLRPVSSSCEVHAALCDGAQRRSPRVADRPVGNSVGANG